MTKRGGPWLPRLLFRLTLSVAALLFGLVLLAPLLAKGLPEGLGVSRVVALFAGDAALRRTALASAAGLAVTACIFFRPPVPPPAVSRKPRRRPPPPARAVRA